MKLEEKVIKNVLSEFVLWTYFFLRFGSVTIYAIDCYCTFILVLIQLNCYKIISS